MAANAFASSHVIEVAAAALGDGTITLESFPPFHEIAVAQSAAPDVLVGDVIVRMAGKRVPRRLTSEELLEGIARRAAAVRAAGAAATPVSIEVLRCAADGADGYRARAPAAEARRACVLGICGGASTLGGRDVSGLPVVADAVGGGGLLRAGDVIIAVDDVPVAPGAAPDLADAESLLRWRSSDFLDVRAVLDGAAVLERDAARYRAKIECLGLELDSPACVTATKATPCASLCIPR